MMWLLGLLATQAVASDCTVIADGRVVHPDGVEDEQTVIVDGGRVVYLGQRPADLREGEPGEVRWRGRDCVLVEARGKVVTAGLVEVNSQLGAVEINAEGRTRDTDAGGPHPVRASLQVADAYNPRSTAIPVSRTGGLTSAMVVPGGGVVSGQSAWVDLAGDTQDEAVIRASVALHANLGGTDSRAGTLALLREVLEDARLYARHRGQWQQQHSLPEGLTRRDLDALQRVLRREQPLVLQANRASDIEAALRFAREEGVRLVILGAAEGWMLADALAAARVPVILDPTVYGPGTFDQVHGRADNPALLAEAGVQVILSSFQSHNARVLRQSAGNAVRGGMAWEDALRAITRTPAEVFGLADRGHLAVGATANLVVWSGDPLELSSAVEHMLIGGREVSLRTRHTELFERYRELPGSPRPGLTPGR